MSDGRKNNGQHPNSLRALGTPWNSETAEAARLKGLETRRRNKEAREAMSMSAAEWKKWKNDVVDTAEITAIDLIRIQMFKFMQEGEVDSAMDLAKTLAEFEMPKLARVDQTVEDVTGKMSDEEVDQRIQALQQKAANDG